MYLLFRKNYKQIVRLLIDITRIIDTQVSINIMYYTNLKAPFIEYVRKKPLSWNWTMYINTGFIPNTVIFFSSLN